jgi:hypothetical protein
LAAAAIVHLDVHFEHAAVLPAPPAGVLRIPVGQDGAGEDGPSDRASVESAGRPKTIGHRSAAQCRFRRSEGGDVTSELHRGGAAHTVVALTPTTPAPPPNLWAALEAEQLTS